MSDRYEKTIPYMYDWKVSAGLNAVMLIDKILTSVGNRHDAAKKHGLVCRDNLDRAGMDSWREVGIEHIMTIARYRQRRCQVDTRIEGWIAGTEPEL